MSAHDTCLWYPAATQTWRSCCGAIHFEPSSGICPDCGRRVEFDKPKDQAEGLRELVRRQGEPESVVIEGVQFARSLSDFSVDDYTQMARSVMYRTIDKSTLWDQLKNELEAEAEGHYMDSANVWHGDALKAAAARAMLDRMLQMETLASFRRMG